MFRDVIIMLSAISVLVITVILAVCIMLLLDGCTLNISNAESYGKSEIEEEQTQKTDVKTDLTIPKLW